MWDEEADLSDEELSTFAEKFKSHEIEFENLPEGLHVFGRNFYKKLIAQGLKAHGMSFFDGTCDANDLDDCVQIALFEHQVYC